MLRRELKAYNPSLLEKPFLVALNKIDQEGSDALAASFRSRYTFPTETLFEISARDEQNLSPLKEAIRALGTLESPALMASATAVSIATAASTRPKLWRSIKAAERIWAMGFAMFFPAMSGAVPPAGS